MVSIDGSGLTLTFTRPKALPDVTYGAESSDGLGTWNPLSIELLIDGPIQTLRARDSMIDGNPACRFIRLRFTR